MTWSDPIVDEVRRIRTAHAARFNYDLDAIFRDLKEREMRSGRKIVSFADNQNAAVSSSNSGAQLNLPADALPAAPLELHSEV